MKVTIILFARRFIMVIDSYIQAAINFLSVFNLKLDNKKLNVLSKELMEKNRLDIYNYKNQVVGMLTTNNNDEFLMNIMMENKTMNVLSYKNTKEPSKFEFKYTILLTDRFYKLSGFASSDKRDDRIYFSNEYKLYEDGKYKLYVYFRPSEKRYGLVEKNHGRQIRLDKNSFKFIEKNYKFKVFKDKRNLYYELIGNSDSTTGSNGEPYNVYGMRKINYKKEEEPGIIYGLLNDYLDDYNAFISDAKDKSAVYSDDLFYNSINKCIQDKGKPKRKLFKLPNK